MVGTAGFKAELKKQLARSAADAERIELLGGGREAHRQLREEAWEERLQSLAKKSRVKLDELPVQKSAPEKVRLAAAMKAATSVSNGWLAERLAMGQPASVSQFVRRFQLGSGNAAT